MVVEGLIRGQSRPRISVVSASVQRNTATNERRVHDQESEYLVLVRLPSSDSRNRSADSPVRVVAGVGESQPLWYEIALSIINFV